MYEEEPTDETLVMLSMYWRCHNDSGQFCWPRGGGPLLEDAATVMMFGIIANAVAPEGNTDGDN